MKAHIIPALCAAVMLSSCADGNNNGEFDSSLPAVGRLKLSSSETTAETQGTETVTETTFESDVTEIPTETEIVSETISEDTSAEQTSAEEQTTAAEESSEAQTAAVQTVSETQATTVTATETEIQTTVSQTETEVQTTTTTTVTAAETKQKNFSDESPVKIIYGGKCVSLSEITDVKKFFGKPVSPEISAPSCLGEGEDIVYIYSDFTVSVFAPKGQSPMVVSVISTGKTIGNPKGITVGASEKSALKALGGDSLEENGTMISFFAEDGKITEVDYIILI